MSDEKKAASPVEGLRLGKDLWASTLSISQSDTSADYASGDDATDEPGLLPLAAQRPGLRTMRDFAVQYAELGHIVVPLWEPLPGGGCSCDHREACGKPGKHPRPVPWGELTKPDPAQVSRWWTQWPTANI